MKTLTLVRHAKSSWKHPELQDWDRPLNKRGRRDAPAMGRRLADRGFWPDRLISSPAARTLATAEAIAAEIRYPLEDIVHDARLYSADAIDLLDIVRELSDILDHVALVGHNPALTDLANRLATGSDIDNVPTCGIVEMDFDTDSWLDVGTVKATRFLFDYPKRDREQESTP
ncbi:MAG: histidine phosphatase family protein [Chloroflexi bacterium]|nr:histidine phosphatase family protein [Chloroflexota bacterium]